MTYKLPLIAATAITLAVAGIVTTSHQSVKLPVSNSSVVVTHDDKEQPVTTNDQPTSPALSTAPVTQPIGQAPDSIPDAADVAPATSPATNQPITPSVPAQPSTDSSEAPQIGTTTYFHDAYGNIVGSATIAP